MLSNVHDYACRETIRRSATNNSVRQWVTLDAVALDVAHIGGMDLYARPGSAFTKTLPADLLNRGVLTTGDFAGHLRMLFTGTAPKIEFRGREAVRGTQALRYGFAIPRAGADWLIQDSRRSAKVGAKGSFWVHPDSLDLLRLEIEADHIPGNMMFRSAKQRIDYARMRVGDSLELLPQTATLNTVLRADWDPLRPRIGSTSPPALTYVRNVIEFSHCREYEARSSVSFEGEAFDLPPGISLTARLSGSVDLSRAAVGDPVVAVLEDPIAGIIPAGASLFGRIRSLEKSGSDCTIALEFLELASGDRRRRFFGEIESVTAGDASAQLVNDGALPGVVTLRIPAGAALDKLRMTWRIGASRNQ